VTGLFTLPGLGFGSSGIVTHGVTDVDTAKWDVPVEDRDVRWIHAVGRKSRKQLKTTHTRHEQRIERKIPA
jgi:hypothetical protein